MPTVTEWQQALNHEYRLTIESSESLCRDVWDQQSRRDQERQRSGRQPIATKDIIPWPPASGQRTVLIRPIDILHALGRITTPPVTELVDLSSTWAEIRYLWAFDHDFNNLRTRALRLSPPVKELDFHQKTLLSDEFGVGFAAYYMIRFERATDPVDVFIARRRGQQPLRGTSRRSLPDYFFTGPSRNQYYVVECKGTQSQRSTAIGQLQRGSEQVMTVGVDPPASLTRLVIGAWLKGGISLLVIDPDNDSKEVRKLSHWSTEEILRFSSAKRLTYIDDRAGAAKLVSGLVEKVETNIEQPRLQPRETDFGAFWGRQEARRTPDGRALQMFRGIESGVLNAARHGELISEIQTRGREPAKGDSPFHIETLEDDTSATVRSISPDGTMFEVRISEG